MGIWIEYVLLIHAACKWNIFKNSLATCAKSQKNNCEISKLLLRAWRCDARMADEQTFSRAPHASRAFFMSLNSLSGRRDDMSAACKLRVWQFANSSRSIVAKLLFNCLICVGRTKIQNMSPYASLAFEGAMRRTFSMISFALWNVLSFTKYCSHFVINASASSKCRCAMSVWISSWAVVNHSGP